MAALNLLQEQVVERKDITEVIEAACEELSQPAPNQGKLAGLMTGIRAIVSGIGTAGDALTKVMSAAAACGLK